MLFLLLFVIAAQTPNVVNPRYAEFTASIDHNATDVTGAPILTRYELQIFDNTNEFGVGQPVNLNKPIPNASNVITVEIKDTILALPSGSYKTRVAAIGPGGLNVSEYSNSFDVNKDLPLSPVSLTIIK